MNDPAMVYREQAAAFAVQFVESGMKLGLGTGRTALFAVQKIAARFKAGELRDILAIATSSATHLEASRLGIPLMPDDLPIDLDLTIDGADEVDPQLNLIKGGGGALLREKIVAQSSRRMIVVVDESKLTPQLGTHFVLPVEVLSFGWRAQARFVESLGARWTLRTNKDGAPFTTDSGNFILDCNFGPIADAPALAHALAARAGIVEHGLFLELATDLVVAGPGGTTHTTRPN